VELYPIHPQHRGASASARMQYEASWVVAASTCWLRVLHQCDNRRVESSSY